MKSAYIKTNTTNFAIVDLPASTEAESIKTDYRAGVPVVSFTYFKNDVGIMSHHYLPGNKSEWNYAGAVDLKKHEVIFDIMKKDLNPSMAPNYTEANKCLASDYKIGDIASALSKDFAYLLARAGVFLKDAQYDPELIPTSGLDKIDPTRAKAKRVWSNPHLFIKR